MSPKALDVPRPASQGGSTGGEAMMCDPYFRPPGSHRATGETSLHPKPLECGMKRLLVSLAAASLIVGLAAGPVAAAAGGVQRNQVTTNVYDLQVGNGHTFTIVFGCGGSLSATGFQRISGPVEDITATLSSDGTWISISSVYEGGWGGSPYSWTGGFPVAGGTGNYLDSGGSSGTYPVVLVTTSSTNYATHGAYVTAMGGGHDAAHSCVGMPIVAQS